MNALEVLGNCDRDSELLLKVVRGTPRSDNRHGDFMIALSAIRRVEDNLKKLVDLEESDELIADTAESLPVAMEPVESAAPKHARRLKLTRRVKAESNTAAALSATADIPSGGPLDAVLKSLAKGPLTPTDLQQAANRIKPGISMQSIYEATGRLKAKGLIESREDDDGDGRRKWFLRGAA